LRLFALIGWPLGHSFSKKYFSEKFLREGINDVSYELLPIEHAQALPALLQQYPALRGLNVTIPHKTAVLPFLHQLDETAQAVGAVNCIKIAPDGGLTGYNTDVIGFEQSLHTFLDGRHCTAACILGTGGAAKAVAFVLQKRQIPFCFVSRTPTAPAVCTYDDLPTHPFFTRDGVLLVNCTPLGTYPNVDAMPPVPFELLKPGILVFDLVYNPAETLLLREASARGCFVQNGLEMLHLQAEAAWEIWQT
jgi:shikimate dehydrogenase